MKLTQRASGKNHASKDAEKRDPQLPKRTSRSLKCKLNSANQDICTVCRSLEISRDAAFGCINSELENLLKTQASVRSTSQKSCNQTFQSRTKQTLTTRSSRGMCLWDTAIELPEIINDPKFTHFQQKTVKKSLNIIQPFIAQRELAKKQSVSFKTAFSQKSLKTSGN